MPVALRGTRAFLSPHRLTPRCPLGAHGLWRRDSGSRSIGGQYPLMRHDAGREDPHESHFIAGRRSLVVCTEGARCIHVPGALRRVRASPLRLWRSLPPPPPGTEHGSGVVCPGHRLPFAGDPGVVAAIVAGVLLAGHLAVGADQHGSAAPLGRHDSAAARSPLTLIVTSRGIGSALAWLKEKIPGPDRTAGIRT